jgi:hypothetical protein
VIDFMPPRGRDPDVVRIVEGLRGEVALRSELVIRCDYGSVVPWVRRLANGSGSPSQARTRSGSKRRRRRTARTCALFPS